MEVKAKLNNLRISPRKAGLVAGLIRRMKTDNAEKTLMFAYKRASDPILKLLRSAVANAKNNFNIQAENLYVKEIKVDEGKTLKRFMPRARGKASRINKRTSNISITLAEDKKS